MVEQSHTGRGQVRAPGQRVEGIQPLRRRRLLQLQEQGFFTHVAPQGMSAEQHGAARHPKNGIDQGRMGCRLDRLDHFRQKHRQAGTQHQCDQPEGTDPLLQNTDATPDFFVRIHAICS